MKEEFVSYEQARKLKECGFDWWNGKVYCTESFCYGGDPDLYYPEGGLIDEYTAYFVNENNEDDYHGIPAPTQALAQKWLREVKGIFVEVHFKYVGLFSYIIQSQILSIYKLIEDRFDTYESALSAGIDAALNLLTEKK